MAERMDMHYDQYMDTIQKIVAFNAKNGIQADLTSEIVRFEAPYFAAKAVVQGLVGEGPRRGAGGSSEGLESSRGSLVQLPIIHLPEFSGDIRQWHGFSELFQASVDDNPQLSDVQKLMYLRTALRDEAASLIGGLPLVGDHYRVAWELLQKRYSNKHLQTQAHLEMLADLPRTSQNPAQIRTFASQIVEATGALTALGYDVESWSVIIIFLCCRKMHGKLREGWERNILSDPAPTVKAFIWFLYEQARILESSYNQPEPSTKTSFSLRSKPSTGRPKGATTMLVHATGDSFSPPLLETAKDQEAMNSPTVEVHRSLQVPACPACTKAHDLEHCGRFRRESADRRLSFARQHHLCLCCLRPSLPTHQCSKTSSCKNCGGRHHTLLHLGNRIEPPRRPASSSPPNPRHPPAQSMQLYTSEEGGHVILATARTAILDDRCQYQPVRVLIDPASQATFITKTTVTRLGLVLRPADVPVLGMGQVSLGVCNHVARCNFRSERDVELQVDALVVDHITRAPMEWLPELPVDCLGHRRLADPLYFQPAEVDVLLGAEWFGCVVVGGPTPIAQGGPCFLETIWGYCLIGRQRRASALACLQSRVPNVMDADLSRFWELEEPPHVVTLSTEDRECEEYFVNTVTRQPSGRYVVSLPFRANALPLGDSRAAALRRFLMLERRLRRNTELQRLYAEFMEDYELQGHMEVAHSPPTPGRSYFIPHHCIHRLANDGAISKFRVVFDSSMTTKDGPSLNQNLLTGPKLQADILDILFRFRMQGVVFVADIRQMYRNIVLSESQQDYQRIFWRKRPDEELLEYRLRTVTYGVSASPFLAIRTLHQLVHDEGDGFPMAAEALMQDTYMDDIIKSLPSVDQALQLRQQLESLLGRAGFELRKFVSNRAEVLASLPPEHCAVPASAFTFDGDTEPYAKILGLVWTPTLDTFSYRIGETPINISKRLIMSDIAKLFDPVGFVGPVIFIGKCLIRELWTLGVDWDERPPVAICERWRRFRDELGLLEQFSLPRLVSYTPTGDLQVHAFADSSELGYAAVLYLRHVSADRQIQVSLLMSKSKVAPVKAQTLPRLELCGIELASRLMEHVITLLRPYGTPALFIWSDSMVALHWVRNSPHRWRTFVSNRVSACQRRVPAACYRYVPTADNPADCASRGLFPGELIHHTPWFQGPPWLSQHQDCWPPLPSVLPEEDAPEAKVVCHLGLQQASAENPTSLGINLCGKYSSLHKLYRVVAWMLRFVHNRVLVKVHGRSPTRGPLSMAELHDAMAACVRLAQRDAFPKDLQDVSRGRPAKGPLKRLNPFLDDRQLLRVGGRLRHSGLPYDQKFPVVLPKNHPLTSLVIDHYHRVFLHPGLSNLRSILHRQYWILSARSAIASRLSNCNRCFRTNPRNLEPLMGDLPATRLAPGRAFQTCGVDYGGPFQITMSRLRKAKILKAYICLFVCQTTKAVHLELASELSTEAFMAAFRRFVYRRGSVTKIFSDCGTNFVGARNQLEGWKTIVASSTFNDSMSRVMAERGIEWSLNPPASPHFGGLFEAGIKSCKRLLARALGDQILTYEEFYTVLVQVEATLNSRPLVPITSDPSELQTLTPAHFLMQEPPSAIPEALPSTDRLSLRNRWELLRQLGASFWKIWSKDYLNELQQRGKWSSPAPALVEGALVLLKEAGLPPLSWRTGRVVRLYPGADGVARVADVRTAGGVLRRATINLCPLPNQ